MKAKLIALLIIGSFQFMLSQEGLPTYQDYLTSSWYLIHPSMAGAAQTNQIRLTARTQWFDVDDAPSLITGSINGRVRNNIGAGILAFSDTNGNFSQNGLYATFAYHINLSNRHLRLHKLFFGISGAIIQRKIDERELLNPNIPDPAITGGVISDNYLNSDFGISYMNSDFFFHFTVKNALPLRKDDFLFLGQREPDNQRRFIGTTGYTLSVGRNDFSLEPSVLFMVTPEINEQIVDANLKAYKKFDIGTLWGGVSYRTSLDGAEFTIDNTTINSQRFNGISPFLGIDYKNFVFAYTYTNQLDEVRISNSGFHQITLGFNFGDKKYRSDETRWNCNCPAVNL